MKSSSLISFIKFGKRLVNSLLPGFSPSFLRANTSKFSALFPEKVRLVRVATGFRFTEGPVWHPHKKLLLFSDIPAGTIYQLSPDGHYSVFRNPSGHSNGLTFDREGRLIACELGNRRVTRTEINGDVSVLTDAFEGKKLNGPNDVVVRKDGSVYFTDPFYKKVSGVIPFEQAQPLQGVYKISPGSREILAIALDFDKPNGLAFSPDETILYVDDSSSRRHVRAFDVLHDGSLTNGRIFHEMTSREKGNPDGMKLDKEGNLYCTGPGGVWVLNPHGQHLGTIVTPEQPSNCAWGDDDFRTLYITARTSVYSIRVNIPGEKYATSQS